jgi:hypothetical protein
LRDASSAVQFEPDLVVAKQQAELVAEIAKALISLKQLQGLVE